MLENNKPHSCWNCGKTLAGRSDKKYCDDNCRNEYFNRQKETERKEIRAIDLALKRNRRILKALFKEEKDTYVKEKVLQEKGFVFNYHTHHTITKAKQDEYLFCYDYGYRKTDEGVYRIIKAFA
ncbi:hypothetical protein FRZ67_19350 [Panacibacter ginsenosidivorans]|uniref:DUF2116 family Zn-ribbon domain-containing protein n=2 Tax=Panacibacter ginsenosidivorans TaxID=1813871 RepID=A0A5B8VJ16_9BACT|nr:hypothetical protein FRZ67_19350 [Panacibacter ginsenosidivorans]